MIHSRKKILQRHVKQIICDDCGKRFSIRDDLKQHIISKHRSNISKDNWLKREMVLLSKIGIQTSKLRHDMASLKEKEKIKNSTCNCKGYCRIVHAHHRWIKSDYKPLESRLHRIENSINGLYNTSNVFSFQCGQCDEEFWKETKLKDHIYENHLRRKNKCPLCGEVFSNERDMKMNKETKHKERTLKSILKKT